MRSFRKLKRISVKQLITSLMLILVFSGILINGFRDNIFHLPYEKIKGRNDKSAIIYVWGHRYFSESGYFDMCELSPSDINYIEQQCAFSVFDMVKEVREKWGWDMYIYYGVQPKFKRHQYENILIIFSGHGKYENNQQFFTYNANKAVSVKEISKEIICNNLTVIADSCFSLNWQNDFQHKNLTNSFASDLCNRTTGSRPYPSCTTEIIYFTSFSYLFLANLYNGLDYYNANITTFEWYYAMFPTFNCSIYSDECRL